MSRLNTSVRVGAYHALMTLRRGRPAAQRWSRRTRATLLATRLAVTARWNDAEVEVSIAPDADIGAVTIDVWPVTKTVVRIGAGAHLEDGVHLSLRGGSLDIGAGAVVRRHVTMHVGGALAIGADTVTSTGVSLHCAESLAVGDMTIIGEYTTIVDSWHLRTPPGEPIWHSVDTAPTVIGRNVWVGAHATIAAGVTVGDQSFVGAGAVVTRDVPAGWLAGGVPAKPLRQLDEKE